MLEETVKEQKLNGLEKTMFAALGTVFGILPPRMQLKIGEAGSNAYEAATVMSLSSRVTNAVFGLYGFLAGTAKVMGGDIDPTDSNALMITGLCLAADSTVRELANLTRYGHLGGGLHTSYHVPWGGALFSLADDLLFAPNENKTDLKY